MKIYPIIALIALLLSWNPNVHAGSCPVGMDSFHEYRLFFGLRSDHVPGGIAVAETDWEEFVEQEITPRFPEGMTVLSARGQFKNSSGAIVRENTKVVVLLVPPGGDAMDVIDEIMQAYRQRFQRNFFLRTLEEVCVLFGAKS